MNPRDRHALLTLAWVLLPGTVFPVFAASSALPHAETDSSTLHVVLPDLVVSSESAAPPPAGRTLLDSGRLTMEDAGTVADLGALFPSTRVSVNSRGEEVLMIRGAPERNVQTFLDGIPLNLPWDERVDLGTVPVTGGMRLEVRRGLASLLEGPGALAGSVRILPAESGIGRTAHTLAVLGQNGLTRLNSSGGDDLGSWRVQGGVSWNNRDYWTLPGSGSERFNSDRDQYAFLARAGRPLAGTGRLNLLLTRWHEVKGVPPELHLGNDARFWRYPLRERTLGGMSLQLPLSADGDWDLSAMLAVDDFQQKTDPRGPDGWDRPPADGEDFEHDKDWTRHAMLGVTHWAGDRLRLTLQGNLRATRHRETLVVGEDWLTYTQLLSAVVFSSQWQFAPGWTARTGAGWDRAATPRTGDKPDRDPESAEAVNLRLEKQLTPDTGVYATASRRSRFPSLRELFSGALGKFLPNPDLHPERQDLLETGITKRGRTWDLASAVFLQDTEGGIEKEKLTDGSGRFMRVNRTDIRVPGWEITGSLRPRPGLILALQHTMMRARVRAEDGSFSGRAEDRPDHLSLASVRWNPPAGFNALVEARLTGSRWSADASGESAATDDLKHLTAAAAWNLRLGWRWQREGRSVEAHLRIENLFDAGILAQTGLPEPGRLVMGGLSLDI